MLFARTYCERLIGLSVHLLCWLLICCWFTTAQAFSLLTYNVSGNGVSDWSTNSLQVQAIGRQLAYLNPDIITFNEIPRSRSHEMTNFVKAYLPGYQLATNSGTDNFIRSVIASRYPIRRSQSWLDGASLDAFGYDGVFTRDLFEAEISVPGFPTPVHIFTTHLKAFEDVASAQRRAAEASAISNFLATVFLPTHPYRPYVLTGDLNEDIALPPTNSRQPIQRLVNDAAGLQLLTPRNPVTGSERTISIRTSLTKRFDYILPNELLANHVRTNLVFRSDRLTPLPPGMNLGDSATASDHLPVLASFDNPFARPFHVTLERSDQVIELSWPALRGQPYRVQRSTNLTHWLDVSGNLIATSTNLQWQGETPTGNVWFRVRLNP